MRQLPWRHLGEGAVRDVVAEGDADEVDALFGVGYVQRGAGGGEALLAHTETTWRQFLHMLAATSLGRTPMRSRTVLLRRSPLSQSLPVPGSLLSPDRRG